MTAKRFNAGDRVRLTGKFLRSIGGSDAYQTWEVMPCACRFCAQHYLVLTDELSGEDPNRLRHILAVNLEKCPY